jgi:phasin family protein
MTSIPQFSEQRNPQSQFDLIRNITARAFASAERVMTLNISTSRASIERSSNTIRQMLAIRDPRDLMALSAHGEQAFHSMLAYSRELFGIVAAANLAVTSTGAAAKSEASAAPAPAAEPAPSFASVDEAIAVQLAQASPEPVVVTEPAPVHVAAVAEAKPVARALSQVAPMPAAAEHPAAAPVAAAPEIELPLVKPARAEAPAAQFAGTRTTKGKRAAAAPARSARKK